ncbi:hypothetical protein Tco_0216523 [Tanacetum coccineum]
MNNINLEPDVALKLGKSMSLIEAAEEEAARQKMSPDPSQKLKGVQTLTLEEQLAADTMQALKARRKSSRSQSLIGGSNEGTDVSPGVLNESTVIPAILSEGTESKYSEEDDDDDDDEYGDDKQKDVSVHGDEQVNDDEDEELTNDTTNAEINSLLDVQIQQEPLVLTPIPKTPSVAHATTLLPPPSVSTISYVPLQTTPIPTQPITTETPPITMISDPLPQSIQKIMSGERYALQKVPRRHTEELIQKYPPQASYKEMIEESVQANLINEVKNQLPQLLPKAVSCFATSVIQITVKNEIEKTPLLVAQSSSQAQSVSQAQSSLKAVESLSKYELKTILFNMMEKSRSYLTHDKQQALFDALFNSLSLDDAIASGQADLEKVLRKRDRDEEDPSAGPNQVSAAKDPLTFNELMVTPIDFFKYAMNRLKIDNLTQEHLVGPVYELLKGTCTSSIELEYNTEECFKALTDKLHWNNPEGDHCPFDLTKPFPLKEVHYVYHEEKAARYEIVGIEDMVPTLWSTTKVGYDKDTEKGIKYWGDKRQLWYRSQINKFSKHNVYSTQKILSVVSVKVKKLHGYGHFDEIVVKRADRQLYKFKDGDFVDLHLNDIEDMLLLAVQHKLFHLNGNDIVDFIVDLRMFTKVLIIKKTFDDYNLCRITKRNLTITPHLRMTFPGIEFKELYTPSFDPPGVIYEDLNKQKRVMRADELYKFTDGTLKTVRDELHHKILDFCLGYNKEMSKRKWTAIDKKRSELMVELIDK